jgi:hypothetical protein
MRRYLRGVETMRAELKFDLEKERDSFDRALKADDFYRAMGAFIVDMSISIENPNANVIERKAYKDALKCFYDCCAKFGLKVI